MVLAIFLLSLGVLCLIRAVTESVIRLPSDSDGPQSDGAAAGAGRHHEETQRVTATAGRQRLLRHPLAAPAGREPLRLQLPPAQPAARGSFGRQSH